MQGPRIDYQVNPRFVPDDVPIWLGNNKDSALIFDNANDEWTVQTKNAAGTLTDRLRIKANTDTPSPDLVSNPLKWTAGRAVTVADYSIGRDLDATNQLHANVPTGATFELSVNDTPEFVLSATQLDLKSNDLVNVNSAAITGATGNTLVVDTNVLVVDATNNRVGIGTAGPSVALDIIGGIKLTTSITFNPGGLNGVSISSTGVEDLILSTNDGSIIRFRSSSVARGHFDGASFQFGTTSSFGGGVLVIGLQNATTVPTTNPTGGGILYSEAGALKWRGSAGTITTIAAA